MYAVMFEVEKDELIYDSGKDHFTAMDKPMVFATKEEAQARANKWNTGRVVPYISPMTDDERQRSKEREAINNVHRRI
jgi:hypothetical protein|tara:strand:- start:22 stop:255 length:234 start_codon:yes stop_codon:yes gene_type:complete